MAPEVVMEKPYNLKADVYSLSILMHEILALKKPFGGSSAQKLITDVVLGGKRPKLKPRWPGAIRDIITMGWDSDISERPTMEILENVI
eukprot:11262949-Ditylum_brightwellii.AAC.1